MSRRTVSPSCVTIVGHGVGKELHEDPEVPNFGNAGRGPRLVPGMCIAVEPMVCQYKYAVKTLKDGWTVKTCDGGLAAHFEHTMAITNGWRRGPDPRLGGDPDGLCKRPTGPLESRAG